MNEFAFKGILQKEGWIESVKIKTNDDGIITAIEKDDKPTQKDFAIPGFQNAHSHAFQYAMAGLAELHPLTETQNDFWSWRKTMYQIALNISPDQLEHIAAMLYKEMLRNGYTHVAEFHYLHHDKNGIKYNNQAEMSQRLMSAAQTAGIKITLIPIFYQNGGFGKKSERSSVDSYQIQLTTT